MAPVNHKTHFENVGFDGYSTIKVDFAQGKTIATVTINRPEAMNAFTWPMLHEFRHLWRKIALDDDINVVILRAAAGRAFSSGADVNQGSEPGRRFDHDQVWNAEDPGEYLGPKFNQCWKPVICAVHGICAGGAFYWLNESDIIICSDDAQFFDPHLTYGIVSALEPIGLRQRIPLGEVLRWLLLSNDERISAQTAFDIRLVSEVQPLEKLYDRAMELAEIIAAKPSLAVQGSLKAVWQSLDMPRSVALATAMKYPQVGSSAASDKPDRSAIMANKRKTYEVR